MKIPLGISLSMIFCMMYVKCLPTSSGMDDNPLKSILLSQAVPSSSQCFTKYLSILSNLSNTFSMQYKACTTLSDQQNAGLYNQVASNRSSLKDQISAMCNAFQSCQSINDDMTFFNCYSTVASESVLQIYRISNSVKDIQFQMKQCQNLTEQTYLTATAETYSNLQNCLSITSSGEQDSALVSEVQNHQSNRKCKDEAMGYSTRLNCHFGSDSSIVIEAFNGHLQNLNQTGCSCDTIATVADSQAQINGSKSITCQCEDDKTLSVIVSGNDIIFQTQSESNECSCSVQKNNNDDSLHWAYNVDNARDTTPSDVK